jgi:hypothetical protein
MSNSFEIGPGEDPLPWVEAADEGSHQRLNTAGWIASMTFLANMGFLAGMFAPWSWLKVCAEGLAIQDMALPDLAIVLCFAGYVSTLVGGWIAVFVCGSRPLKIVAAGLTVSSLVLLYSLWPRPVGC